MVNSEVRLSTSLKKSDAASDVDIFSVSGFFFVVYRVVGWSILSAILVGKKQHAWLDNPSYIARYSLKVEGIFKKV